MQKDSAAPASWPGRDCLTCGTPLGAPTGRGRPPKYCSPQCRRAAPDSLRAKNTLSHIDCICEGCGEPFRSVRQARFCSRRCRARSDEWQKLQKVGRDCRECGRTFIPAHFHQALCGEPCSGRPRLERVCVCSYCGDEFHPKAANRLKFCSRECAFAKQAADRAAQAAAREPERTRKKELERERRAAERDSRPRTLHKHKCEECGAEFQSPSRARKYCSIPCRSLAYYRKKHEESAEPAACKQCGEEFLKPYGASGPREFCSEECQEARKQDLQRKTRKMLGNHRRRARTYGGSYEPVDPMVVFERDGWRCHICKRKTPKRFRGTIEDAAPELDHIVPLAAGGDHSYQNTACCCRACNLAKGARPLGQLLLDIGPPVIAPRPEPHFPFQ